MNLRTRERNIPIMYVICFFQGIVLYASISTLYRQARGLSLSEYAVIDGFSYLFQLAFEIPFGMLADRIGYKKTLIFSNGLYLVSKIIFWQAYSKRVTVSDRATQLSVYAMLSEIISFSLSFLMSAVTAYTYTGAFLLCAGMALTGIFLFLYCYRGVRSIDE